MVLTAVFFACFSLFSDILGLVKEKKNLSRIEQHLFVKLVASAAEFCMEIDGNGMHCNANRKHLIANKLF